jgi:hypothetical protein
MAPGGVLEKGSSILKLRIVGSAAERSDDRGRHDDTGENEADPAVRAVPQSP